MKRDLLLFLGMAAAFGTSVAATTNQFTFTYEGIELTYQPRSTLSNCTEVIMVKDELADKVAGKLVLPDKVTDAGTGKEYSLYSIPQNAFEGNLNITEVDLGQALHSIGNFAFRDCKNLVSVTFPKEFDQIGNWAFGGCTNLENVSYIDVTQIGLSAFRNCTSLKEVQISDELWTMGDYAFGGCTNLTTVNIPHNTHLSSVGMSAFMDCKSLEEITVPNNIKTIKTDAFNGCSALKSVVIEEGTQEIYTSAFSGCTSLEEINIPSSVVKIWKQTFQNCTSLETLILPDHLSDIGENVFKGCSSLKSINIPTAMSAIPDGMFTNCSGLSSIEIPLNVTSIGNNAFSGCSALAALNIPNTVTSIGSSAFEECTLLAEAVLPASVSSLGSSAFQGCTQLVTAVLPPAFDVVNTGVFKNCGSLIKIYLGPNITEIGADAFTGTQLTDIYITAQVPPAADDAALPDNIGIVLHIQGDDAKDAYAADDYWSAFTDVAVMTKPTAIEVKRIITDGDREIEEVETFVTRAENTTADDIRYVATLIGGDNEIPYVFWKSSDPSKVYVDNNGVVTLFADTADDTPVDITAESLYADGPTYTVTGEEDITTGVDEIADDANGSIDAASVVGIYTLDGRYAGNSLCGLAPRPYICATASGKTCKILLK
ncbi:MAG: leucine-rich repeat domain-containing protein [Muribaculaceae bacterium]|nr:leucine-rich repeat domain-containing protein [Muribaculaceae bacterium]